MTFYNVLSALLFVGALRVLLLGLEASRWSDVFAAGCLVILVFNDMLSTSYAVESNKEDYTLPLMVIDLCNFLLLAGAMIIISPTSNLFDVPLPRIAAFLGPASFWLFLVFYWLLLMRWTHLSETNNHEPPATRAKLLQQASVAMVFGMEWLFHLGGSAWLIQAGRVIALFYVAAYMVWLRPHIFNSQPAAAE